jgi:hypothetical protein
MSHTVFGVEYLADNQLKELLSNAALINTFLAGELHAEHFL